MSEQLIIEINEMQSQPIKRSIPRDGKPPIEFTEQIAYAYTGDVYPVKIKVSLEEGQAPYAAGKYHLHPKSFVQGKYDKLEFARNLVLVPAEEF
ncbi:DNA-binding protein [Plesiomonas shigelloides]|uniref:single-stranded DNA-binding protein n=1 Tax=Plesiomonas shigelloides TaxID=703 RepID=UPI0022478208|nr:single-stranded DNA-binding protein [Plesiomonas shigelloides]MCX2534991.1 DNA-binding protein [Plesiomonas shigelloides]